MFDLSAAGVAIRTVARRSVPKRWGTFIVDPSIGKTTCESQAAPRLSLRSAQRRLDGHPVTRFSSRIIATRRAILSKICARALPRRPCP